MGGGLPGDDSPRVDVGDERDVDEPRPVPAPHSASRIVAFSQQHILRVPTRSTRAGSTAAAPSPSTGASSEGAVTFGVAKPT